MATAEFTDTQVDAPALNPPQIHQAIIAIMREVGAIGKDEENTLQKYRFRGVDSVYNRVHPLFAKHGVYSTSELLDKSIEQSEIKGKSVVRAYLAMRFTYWSEDGSSVSTDVVGEGMDYNGDKACNKAMSVADKYAILQLLKIPTAMVDPDRPPPQDLPSQNNAPQVQPRGQRVTAQEITDCVAIWKMRRQELGQPAEITDWQKWVHAVTERSFNVRQSGEWTVEDLNKVRAARESMK